MNHIAKAKVPVIGFVNENKLYSNGERDQEQIDLLRRWTTAGLELGNHTYSHISLHSKGLEEYEADLIKGETITAELLAEKGKKLRFFRHPYLMTGLTPGADGTGGPAMAVSAAGLPPPGSDAR